MVRSDQKPAPFILLFVAAVVLLLWNARSSAVGPEVRAAIQAAYDRQSQAYAHKDVDGVVAECAPDYEDVNGSESTRLADYRTMLAQLFSLIQSAQVSAHVKSVRKTGDGVEATTARRFVATFMTPKKGKPEEMVTTETLRDTWVERNGKWLKRRSIVAQTATTFDGKPQP